jgi:hypothetical protein
MKAVISRLTAAGMRVLRSTEGEAKREYKKWGGDIERI